MKKTVLFTLAITLFSFVNAQNNVIKLNPLAILGGSDLVSYEIAMGDASSLSITAAYGGYKLSGIKYSNVGGGIQYRFYFDETLNRFYAGPFVSFTSGKTEFDDVFIGFEDDDSEIKFTSIGGGGKIGHQWIWDSGFSLDLNVGVGYRSFNYKFSDDDDELFQNLFEGSGTLPNFGFGIGYAF